MDANGNEQNGARYRPMHSLEISVAKDVVTAKTRGDPGWNDPPIREDFAVDERRDESIDVLVRVLRHAMDAKEDDRLRDDTYHDLLKMLGRELFDLLFADEKVRRLVLGKLSRVHRKEITLRMLLTFARPNLGLSKLPWEYLHTPVDDDSLGHGGGFLSQHAELLLSRRLEVGGPGLRGAAFPLKILLISSSPKGEHMPRVDAEIVHDALSRLDSFDVIDTLVETPPADEVAEYKWKATFQELEAAILREDPHIVHFIGHGRMAAEHGELALAKGDGSPSWVTDEAFANAICQGNNLKLVFLQACESALPPPYVGFAGVAQAAAGKGIPAVIAMQYPIKVPTANEFAVAFYEALDERVDIDVAVERGRAAIRNGKDADDRERLAFGLPVVYLTEYGGLSGRGDATVSQAKSLPASKASADDEGRCPNTACGFPYEPGDTFCGNCSAPLQCGKCSRRLRHPPPRYCPKCQAPVPQELEVEAVPRDELTLLEMAPQEVVLSVRSAIPGPGEESS